jgi:hypothetical protein
MTAQRMQNRVVLSTAAAAALLFLAGCGTGTPQAQTSSTAAPLATTSSEPATSAAPTATSTPAPAGTASPPAAAPAPSVPAGPGLCKASGLAAAIDSTGGGAAGSVYMQLILTNSGTEPCLLRGYPGVSLTAAATGDPIGAPAERDAATPAADVLLAPGQAGTATLRYSQARNHADCTVVPAAGIRIYPPEDTASLFIAQPRDACSNPGTKLLTVGAFRTS